MKKNNLLYCIFLFLIGISCTQSNSDKAKIVYSENFNGYSELVLYNFTDCDELPDSIFNRYFTCLNIQCSELTDYSKLFSKIKPDSIFRIIIYSYDTNKEFSYDLYKYKMLDDLRIVGRYLEKINLKIAKEAKLKSISFYSPVLQFPDFDSSMMIVKYIDYSGNSRIIPKWVEYLKSLKEFSFNSKNLERIDCDICKMDALDLLNIENTNFYKRESLFKEKNNRYDKLERYVKCKPNLEYIYTPLPYK